MPIKLTPTALSRLRRTRWTTETARAVLAAQHQSGECLTVFARRHGLEPQRLFWWRKRLGEWDAPAEGAGPLLVPVVTPDLTARTESAGSVSAALRLRCGEVELEFADASTLPPAWLAALVRELGARR